ncbi:MAG TPA: PQQ-binding-like beta-propeller repeat protein [Alphaproteobacteria bacterium]|nr:PQQ-binding-like beta-propeller repeat protein [Alphaproteobacteria bacterium]
MTTVQFARRGRELQPGQRSELTVIDVEGRGRAVVFTAAEVIEAPNWTPDGEALIFNAGGELWRIPADGSAEPRKIDTGPLRDLNNDHVLSPDGRTIYVSSDDGHLYAVPIGGGDPRRISNRQPGRFKYYLHGISPDGKTLAYVGVQYEGERSANIYTIPAAGGPDTQLTHTTLPCDGPEFSPAGDWIWFNAELNSPGHAQLFRMRPDGSEVTQVTFDERVNWFPHLAPDGQSIVYLSYPPGTQGHPADKEVILRFLRPDGSGQRDIVSVFGGQGTINVNSWAPDSRRFAYVAYPLD